jgi:hypothetical protein
MFQIYLIRSAETRRLGPFQVGNHTASNTNNVIRIRTKVVIPRSRRSPHLVVLQQVRVYEHTQLGCMTKERHPKP